MVGVDAYTSGNIKRFKGNLPCRQLGVGKKSPGRRQGIGRWPGQSGLPQAAIGDPGPEKIRIERAAARYNIPLRAIVVKMAMEEAIQEMKEEIAKAADKVVDMIKDIVLSETREGDRILIAGIGNTVGIAQ